MRNASKQRLPQQGPPPPTPPHKGEGSALCRGRARKQSRPRSPGARAGSTKRPPCRSPRSRGFAASPSARSTNTRARVAGSRATLGYDARDDAGGRARRRRPGDAAFAPVKGAGARFVKRADKGKPVAAGLKATDALSAARAAADCAAAETMGREALAEAAWTRWDETFRVWLKTADSLRAALAAHRARRRKRANGARRARDAEPDAYEQWLERAGHMACDALEYCQAQSARCGFVEILAAGAVSNRISARSALRPGRAGQWSPALTGRCIPPAASAARPAPAGCSHRRTGTDSRGWARVRRRWAGRRPTPPRR